MTTINDLELNEHLVKVPILQNEISENVRQGKLRAAACRASELHAVTREIDWRLQKLLTESK
jgi:hypothetical protein